MIGTTMLNEEIMHARVGDVKGHSQGGHTRCGNASMELDPPYGIRDSGVEIPGGNWTLTTKDLGKQKL